MLVLCVGWHKAAANTAPSSDVLQLGEQSSEFAANVAISYLPYLIYVLWLKYTSKPRLLVTAHKVHVVRDYE
jgi:hypothetical protein